MIYLLTAIKLPRDGSSTVHIYTQKNTQNETKHTKYRTTQKFWKSADRAPVFAGYTLAFALQLRKKHGKTLSQGSRKVPAGTMKIHKHTLRIHRHNNKNIFKLICYYGKS
jgi:hypothetical protein